MKVLVDTNVVLDVLLAREPHVVPAAEVFRLVEGSRIEAFLCATTVTTISYLLRRGLGRDKARRLLRAWLRILVADGRGAEFVCDLEEDSQIQRAILEIAGQFDNIDPKAIPEYRFFADKAPKKPEAKKQEADDPED